MPDVFIIAEVGKNFIQTEDEQSAAVYIDNAKKLIKAAKESGADAVKFQTHNYEDEQLDILVTSPHFQNDNRYHWVKRNTEITPIEFWREINAYAKEIGITFFSTPMSRGAAEKLNELDVPIWKVGSGDILDFVLLDYIARTGKPIIISSGMSMLKEIDRAVNFLKKRNSPLTLLHCVSKYPCPPEDLNLKTINFLQNRYRIPIGFSDHSPGWESAVAATHLGATMIEKHFSFSREHWGADHKVSLIPDEFREMVDHIRRATPIDMQNYGRRAKILHKDEKEFRPIFRKSLVAGQDIQAGTILEPSMIYAMRPQMSIPGLPSEEYESIINKKVTKDLKKFEPLTWDIVKNSKPRKICFIITSKIHYARSKILLQELQAREDIELQIVIGASAILEKYGDIESLLEEDGFAYNAKIIMTLEGGSPVAMAKTTGIGITEFATAFDNLKPDIVLVRGDRYEVLSATVAAAYINIPVAHIEGGDLSGTIDESVRHAITKLAHIHFTTNAESCERVKKMGENPDYVFNVGCPEIEFVAKNDFEATEEYVNCLGVGDKIDITQPYLIAMQHPVTSEIKQSREQINETLYAVSELKIPTIWFWPNADAGSDEISKMIRVFRENNQVKHIRFIRSLPPEEFIGLLKKAACLVGNSSAGIKECSYLGVPVVNIGTRQNNRQRADNVLDAQYDKEDIKLAIAKQLEHGAYESSSLYFQENTSQKIADILASVELYTQKRFHD
ncbi:MAG: UDP-N-acetylglucosamine 2-epimerase [Patescibacteria group bacterium]